MIEILFKFCSLTKRGINRSVSSPAGRTTTNGASVYSRGLLAEVKFPYNLFKIEGVDGINSKL